MNVDVKMKKRISKPKTGKKKVDFYDVIVVIILSILALIIIYPMYNALVISLMNQKEYTFNKFAFWPKSPTLFAYQTVLNDKSRWLQTGYKNTAFMIVCTVVISLFATTPCAYALSKKRFPGKMLFLNFILFTMFFTGGTIPFFILIKDLGLIGNVWSVILPFCFTPFHMLIMRNFFSAIPESIEESARMDGAGEWRILFSIILPVSKPVLASVALFKAVDVWNEWFYSLLFLGSTPKNYPLQFALREMLTRATTVSPQAGFDSGAQVESVKMAAVIVSIIPIMLLYPLIQKYFVRGIMVGSVKG